MTIRSEFLLMMFLVVARIAQAQPSYPQNYFRHPLNIPMQLVANFGEIRTNHWHMGLDIRTQQRVNLPVFAAADGYVSRVVVEPGGFGQAIYITHPNGFTTLYAHMNSFFPALAQWVKEQQYQQQSWHVNLLPPAELFPLKKGTLIGLSGSTGASQGPHVHFEIRDAKTENCYNPLLFSFPIPDAVAPTINRLALYDRNRSTYEQSPQLLKLARSGGAYTIASGSLRVGTNRISFAIGAIDRFSGTPNPNGIYSAVTSLDGVAVASLRHDNISYNDTRYINAQLDFPYKARGGGDLQHLSPLPGEPGVAYQRHRDEGIIVLRDEEPHRVEIEVRDAAGNLSTIRFTVQYDPSLAKAYPAGSKEQFLPNHLNVLEREGFELFTTERTIYDTVEVSFSESTGTTSGAASPLFRLWGTNIPAHDSLTVRIRPLPLLTKEDRERVVVRNQWGSRTYLQKGVWQRNWVAAKFRQFGTYQVLVDRTPPQIPAVPSDLTKASRIVVTPTDNLGVIRSFRAELNGQWLRFSNDKGRSWIYSFDEYFPRGSHTLTITVEDEAGNVSKRSFEVKR